MLTAGRLSGAPVRVAVSCDTVTHMKTTIELPDELVEQVRRVARRDGVTMRELMVEGLRSELARRQVAEPEFTFAFTSVKGHGLQPGVQPRHLTDLAYGDDVTSR